MNRSDIFVIAQLLLLLISYTSSLAVPEETQIQDTDVEAKGILDGVTGGQTTSSPSAPGLGGLGSLGQNVGSGVGPMLIIGGFQAIVTKFDPSLIQGLPGLSGVAGGLPTGK